MKIALFALEALPNARALRKLVQTRAANLCLLGLSNPTRAGTGGLSGQVRRHLRRSGPRILPYLAVNFGLPDLLSPLVGAVRDDRHAPLERPLPLAKLCARLGIPALAVDDVNGPVARDALRAARPDLIVTFHFDQILAAETIALAPLGGLNVHPALLPRHRGPVPTIHALADGDRAFGVTVHRLVPAIDAGAILAQAAPTLPATVTATRAARMLHDAGLDLLLDLLDGADRDARVLEGTTPATLPYCPWPDAAMLAAMRRQNLRLVDRADLWDAATLFLR